MKPERKRKKKPAIIIAVVVGLLLVLAVGKNLIAKVTVTTAVKAITGLDLKIKQLNVGILKTRIGIEGLEVFNPPDFEDNLMVDMPEIYADYDLGAFLRKKIHLEEMRLHLKEFVVVKNASGELNLDRLKTIQAQKEEKPGEKEKPQAETPEMRIDILALKIGKVVYKDYSQGTPPQVREFNVNLDERFENITNPNTLANLIVVKALMNTTIGRLADFDLGPLTEGITSTLKTATGLATETADKALDTGKDIGVKAKDAAAEAADTIKKILPFGK